MKKTASREWFQIKAVSPQNLEVRIFGEIGWEVYADEFIRALDAHPKTTELDIRINSVGGSVFEGLHIFNRLVLHEGTITCTVEGLAASMASVIAMAGETVRMMPMSLMMIHNPATGAWGDQRDLEKTAETLAKIKEILIDAYERKTKKPRDVIATLMDDETWFTAQEAVDEGFADSILDDGQDLDLAACLEQADLSWFKHRPTLARVRNQRPAASSAPIFVLVEPNGSEPKPAATALDGAPIMDPEEIAAKKAAEEKANVETAAVAKARKEEKERRDDIRVVFTGFTSYEQVELLNKCLEDMECGADQARVLLLESLKGKTNSPTGAPHVIEDEADKLRSAASDWITARAGLKVDGKIIRVTGDNPFRGMRLLDLARDSLERNGVSTRGKSPMEIVNAAISHSTSDFPNLMQDAMYKLLLNGFSTAGDTWSTFCKTGDLSDFRPHYRHIMGSFSDLLPVGQNGEIQDGTLDDTRKESITGSTKGRILNLSHQAIVNDDMSVFSDAAVMMGRAARRAVENDVYALLASGSDFGPTMSDGTTLFHANHGNVSTGAPSVDSVEAAINVLRSQSLPNGDSGAVEYIDLASPPIFVGPLGQGGNMRVINEAQYDPDTANKLQKPNKSRGLVGEIVTTPRRTGLPWFLFANPAELPVIEVGFVQGEQEPQLIMQEAFRQYGVSWRVVYDYGVAAVNWLGCVRSTGA